MIIQKCEIEGCDHTADYTHKVLGLVLSVCGDCQKETQVIASEIMIKFEKFRQKQYEKLIKPRS